MRGLSFIRPFHLSELDVERLFIFMGCTFSTRWNHHYSRQVLPLQGATRIVLTSEASGGIEKSEASEHFPITKSHEHVQSPASLAMKTRIHARRMSQNRIEMVISQRVKQTSAKQASAKQAGTSRRGGHMSSSPALSRMPFPVKIAGTPCFAFFNICGTGVEGRMARKFPQSTIPSLRLCRAGPTHGVSEGPGNGRDERTY